MKSNVIEVFGSVPLFIKNSACTQNGYVYRITTYGSVLRGVGGRCKTPPHAITMSSLTHAVNQCSINSSQPCTHAVVNQCLLNAVVVMLSAHAQTLYDCLCDACWWSVDAVVIFLQTTLIPRPPSATVSSPRSHRAEI